MRAPFDPPRGILLAALIAAGGLQACRNTEGAPDLSPGPTPAPPTLAAAAVQGPAVIATAIAAEPTYAAIQLESVISDERAAEITKISIWMNDQGERREEASADSLHNPGVITVFDLETVSRYNPATELFSRSPRPINAFDDGPPYAKSVLGDAFIGEVRETELDGVKAVQLLGRPMDDPLRPAVPTDLSIWLDAETHRILRLDKIVRPKLGPPFRMSTRPVAYDPQLPPDHFRLDPPAVPDLRVVDATLPRPESKDMTMEEARAALGFPLLDHASLPDGIRLERLSATPADDNPANGDEGLLAQFYADSNDNGYLIAEQFAADPPGSARRKAQMDAALRLGEAVKVGEHDAVYVSRLGTTYLLWQTEETRIKLSPNQPEIDKDALVAWAEAMR